MQQKEFEICFNLVRLSTRVSHSIISLSIDKTENKYEEKRKNEKCKKRKGFNEGDVYMLTHIKD
jgi:hypothetical protein